METNIENAFTNAKNQLKKSFDMIPEFAGQDYKYEIISNPKRLLEISIPIKMDN
jgi:hypothetical protein